MQDRKQIQRDAIMAECEARHIRVEHVGQAYRLTAPGVSLLVSDLANLDVKDIAPFVPQTEKQARA